MSSWMDKAKKFREDHKETFDKVEAKARELGEQGKEKLDEARERFDDEQAKRERGDAAADGAAKPDVPADDGAASAADTAPEDSPPPAPPAGSTPPPPPPPAAA